MTIKRQLNFGKEAHEMQIYSTYSVKIKQYNHIFADTISVYREAVDFLIEVCLKEWDNISCINGTVFQQQYVERLCHKTKKNPETKYGSFDKKFYKFPSYLRRGAIQEAIGKVASYQSNLKNWEAMENVKRGKKPSYPKAGYIYPCMYKTGMYEQTDTYEAKIKVFVRHTWDWITVQLRKSDIDYINRNCTDRKRCAPTLQKRGREWFLDFPFEENVTLNNTTIWKQTVLGVDLGIHCVATVSVMQADGTVIGRHFLRLPKEYDCLKHAINRIKKAQQNGNAKTPRLWAKAKGINDDIAVKTAKGIMDIAEKYQADVIVFEHLERKGKKRAF